MNEYIRSIIVLLIGMLVLSMSIPGNISSENQIHATDVDLNAGIFENTEVVGTGTDAYIRLGLTEDGSYATGFDNDGANSTNPHNSNDYSRSVVVDTNYIYVAGYDVNALFNYQWRVEKRDKISGALVTTFDSDGVVISNPSGGSDQAHSIVVDSSYIYVAGYDYSQGDYQWRVEKRDKYTGALVSAFDTDGIVESNPSINSDYAYSIAVDSDYIYIAGMDGAQTNFQWRIEKRDKTTGALVSSFDTDGVVQTNPSGSSDYARSITVDTNYIYVAGYDTSTGNAQWRIEKRDKTTGALVTAFDSDGVAESNPSGNTDQAYSIVVDSDYIYIAGYDQSQVNYQWRIEKRDKSSGALVSAFDTDGVVESNPSGNTDQAFSIAVDSDYIYITGDDLVPGNYQWRVEKRDKTSGALVTAFDTDGVVESNPSGNTDQPNAIAIDSNSIYVVGIDRIPGNYEWRLEKKDITTGANASGFDSDGVVENNPSSGSDGGESIAIDSDYIYIGAFDDVLGNQQWRIEKRDKTTGALVTSFDTDGVVQSNPSSNDEAITQVVIDSDYIYAIGYDNNPGDTQWRVEKRYKTSGALVTAFDSDGIIVVNPSSFGEYVNSIAVDSNYIYIVGQDAISTNYRWHIEKRDKTSGALVTAFDSDGVILHNPTSGSDGAEAIALDSTYLYIAGYDNVPGNQQWRIEKRDKTTGALITSFDSDGVVVSNPSANNENPGDIAVDLEFIYIVGTDRNHTDRQWRVEKRDKTTGALVTAFDTDGIVATNPSSDDDNLLSIEVDSDYIYLAGRDNSRNNYQWRIEKRDKITGALVTDFDTDGVIESNPSTGADFCNEIALDGGYIYSVGSDYSNGDYQLRIEKYNNHVYPEHGLYYSPIIESSGADNVVWSTISWTSDVLPPDTMIKFQLAANDYGTYWEYSGPDGTEDTYYETAGGQAIWSGLSGKFLKYRAFFTSTDLGYTPTLDDVKIIQTVVDPPEVEVTSPNGGEDWMKDDFYPITWNAEGEFNSTPVQLSYSTDNGETWSIKPELIANTGYYNWTVPNVDTPSALVRINVTDIYGNSASDTSDASFAIDPPPFVPVDSNSDSDGTIERPTGPDDGLDTGTATEGTGTGSGDNSSKEIFGYLAISCVLLLSIIINVYFIIQKKDQGPKGMEAENKNKKPPEFGPKQGGQWNRAKNHTTKQQKSFRRL